MWITSLNLWITHLILGINLWTICYNLSMPIVLCFNCGGTFEVSYQTSKPTSACPKCQDKMFEEQISFEE